jgi:hypothetical protein
LVTDQVAVQPPLAVCVGLVLGVALGLVLGVALGVTLGLVGVTLGLVVALGVVLGVTAGGCPVPLAKTTIDCAGTLTDVPEKLLDVTDGLAAE